MSWIGGECQDDRHYSCTYATFDTFETFCIDSDTPCISIQDAAGLIQQVDNFAPADDGW
jgi:hypothetical protein